MTTITSYKSIDEYIANFPEKTQEILQKIRELAHQYMPTGVSEAIRYGVPTIKVNGKNVFHFAAFTKHVSTYPACDQLIAKHPVLAQYRTGKGTLQFKLDTKIPFEMIEKFVIYQAKNL